MRINIHGRKVEITESIKAYIEEKIGKVEKYIKEEIKEATVVVKVREKEQKIEVTIPVKGRIIRAEEESKDLYEAIDLVVEKLERQLEKVKTKMKRKGTKRKEKEEIEIEEKEKIVKRKEIEMKPMSEEEAMLQMELIGHDFFVFKNEESEEIEILYRRKEGNYGIIKTRS